MSCRGRTSSGLIGQYHFGITVLSKHIFTLSFRLRVHAFCPFYVIIVGDTQFGKLLVPLLLALQSGRAARRLCCGHNCSRRRYCCCRCCCGCAAYAVVGWCRESEAGRQDTGLRPREGERTRKTARTKLHDKMQTEQRRNPGQRVKRS